MVLVSIARRYARALLEVALETGNADAVLAELEALAQKMDEVPELRVLMESPAFTRPQRAQVLEAIADEHGFSGVTKNFLRLLLDRDRTTHLPMIVRIYRELADVAAGRVRAEVTTPMPLPPEQLKSLQEALARATGKTIEMQRREDPSLLGGLVARVGDRVFDGSLKTQLRQLKDTALSR